MKIQPRILLLADIHIGSIKDVAYMYNVLTNIIDEEIAFKKTDLVVILGDYFDRLFKVNEEYVSCAINVMSHLIRICAKTKTKIRIVYGTESHEMNQYRLFNYHITSSDIDMKIFDTVTEEETIDGSKMLYIPEEYINDKHDHYKKYLYSGKTYDYIFGHGVIVDGMPRTISFDTASKSNEKQVPRFKSGEFSDIAVLTVFGHYHCYTNICDNVYYLGSLFRDSFGEEIPKGYGVIEDGKFAFIENDKAYVYKTYEFDTSSNVYGSSDDILREIDKIKKENAEIFSGERQGKIRIVFNTPSNVDPSFRENLKGVLFNDKYIAPLIKESNEDLIEEVKDDIDPELDFIIDSSLPIIDKIHRFMECHNGYHMSMEKLTKYLAGIV